MKNEKWKSIVKKKESLKEELFCEWSVCIVCYVCILGNCVIRNEGTLVDWKIWRMHWYKQFFIVHLCWKISRDSFIYKKKKKRNVCLVVVRLVTIFQIFSLQRQEKSVVKFNFLFLEVFFWVWYRFCPSKERAASGHFILL
jgi:hypothetical protein